jgi:hypothetical protein
LPNIEYLPPQELKPWPGNSRKHSRKQIRQLIDSIRRFGFTTPVVIDENNCILAGHGRVRAACLLGLADVPCQKLDHLSETEKRAYVIADNKLALNSTWDGKRLAQEIRHFRTHEVNFDVGVIGFTIGEMDRLFELKTDRQGASPAPARCAPGDIWRLGRHRLVCGERLCGPVFDGYPRDYVEEMIVIKPPNNASSDADGKSNAEALFAADKASRVVLLAEPDPAKCDRVLACWDIRSQVPAAKIRRTTDHSPIKLEIPR